MKKQALFILLILTLFSISVKAQDTVVLRNGNILSVKVTEVSKTQIKYLLWNSQDGPVYVQEVGDIYMIKYHNGTKKIYEQDQAPSLSDTESTAYYGRLERKGKVLLLNGKELSKNEARSILGQERYNTFTDGLNQSSAGGGYLVFSVAFAIGEAAMLVNYSTVENGAKIGWIMIGVADVLLPIGIVLKSVGNGRANWAVNDYNYSTRQLSQSSYLEVGPSLVCVPTATGSNYALGAGLRLNF